MELSTERSIGMGVGCIPMSKIRDYVTEFKLPDWYTPVLAQVDAHYVTQANTSKKEAA